MIGPRHPSVKRLRRLARQRRDRSEQQAFVIEGWSLLDEALRCGVSVEAVFAEPEADRALVERARGSGAAIYELGSGTLASATDTMTPQPVAAIAQIEDTTLHAALDKGPRASPGGASCSAVDAPRLDQVVVLVGVGDPGNLGTLLRSADAVGATLVVCCDNTVDPYGPKSVRASAGALFRVRVVRDAAGMAAVAALRRRGVACLGMVVRDGIPYDRIDLVRPWAIVLGNETHGLSETLRRQCDELITIPMHAPAESLNVGMAGTVVCFEALRQRRARS
jgi:TrmH family RNA methyltransferase